MATDAESNKTTKGRRMSLEMATRLFDWSSIALAIGACIVFVATAAIVWLGIVKEHHWELLREHANEKIAAVGLETAKANAELGTAQADIAKAQATAATANLEAARLRFELDREIQKRAQRLLTDEQKSAIADELNGKIAEIALIIQHDPETRAFSVQVMAGLPPGITIYAPEPPREDKWFAPAGMLMFSPLGSNEDQLKDDPLYRALKRAGLFGGTTGKPFLSPDVRGPIPALIPGYTGHVLYIGQKSPF
ncbi:hypothetical protein [Tardiphaga sp. 367_B4_N1_1]|uniref:hypothetical protein n=1 Tax=Tardiphaga sp. 367_B4_N1_1 TaxID=3240777 RepID=UPI003F24AF44